ncbi:MAG TPA: hypothetical protein VG324_18450, partial [Blastocatellia bacterium]|nr:hypothetical protein [Blastocatellia bacterium]
LFAGNARAGSEGDRKGILTLPITLWRGTGQFNVAQYSVVPEVNTNLMLKTDVLPPGNFFAESTYKNARRAIDEHSQRKPESYLF